MADHRAEQIMSAIETLLTGLTTTGSNVKRDRVYSWDTANLPALSIFQGDDTPIPYADRNYFQDDFELTVHIEMHAENADTIPISTTLNQIRKEVIIAIQADYTLGLSFVIDTEEQIASQPQIEHINTTTATQVMDFTVKYRRSRADPSA